MKPRLLAAVVATAAYGLCATAIALPVAPGAKAVAVPWLDFGWVDTVPASPGCEPGRALAPSRATGPWVVVNLETALAAVACQFLGVHRGQARQQQARAEWAQAQAAGRPNLGITTGADAERGSKVGWSSSVQLAWVLFDFGRNQAQMQQADEGLVAAQADARTEALTAVGEAATRFAAAEAAFGRWEAAQINVRIAQEGVQVARARQGEGASAMSDVVQAQVALAQAQMEQLRSGGQWLAARGALAVAMGLGPQTALAIGPGKGDDVASNAPALATEALLEEALAQHPRMVAARARLAQARAQVRSTQSERWGSVVLNASAGRSRPTYGQDTAATGSAQIAWRLPLYDGGGQSARQQAVQAGLTLAEVALEEARREVTLQVWQQVQALTSEFEVGRTSQWALENAQAALNAATERYRLGVGRFVELQTAQVALAATRLQRVETRANLRREQQQLAVALGRLAGPAGP